MKNTFVKKEEHMELVDGIKVELNRLDDQFDTVHRRFDIMDQRFNKFEEGFNKIDKYFDGMNDRFNRIEQHLSYHDSRFNDIEKQLSAKVDNKDFRTLVSVLKAGKALNEHEADHFLIPVSY